MAWRPLASSGEGECFESLGEGGCFEFLGEGGDEDCSMENHKGR
jgi:hypothetical protein